MEAAGRGILASSKEESGKDGPSESGQQAIQAVQESGVVFWQESYSWLKCRKDSFLLLKEFILFVLSEVLPRTLVISEAEIAFFEGWG